MANRSTWPSCALTAIVSRPFVCTAIVYRPLCGGAEQQDSGGAEQQEQRVTTGATRHNWTDYQFIKRWNLQKAATTLNYYAQRSVSTPELRRPSF